MSGPVFADTGPIVALLSRNERHHEWAKARMAELRPPLITCEAVIAEACWLLRSVPRGSWSVFELMSRGVVRVGFDLESEAAPVAALMARYASVPMALAAACLVRMSELEPDGRVLTLDGDFRIYRREGRRVVPTIMP